MKFRSLGWFVASHEPKAWILYWNVVLLKVHISIPVAMNFWKCLGVELQKFLKLIRSFSQKKFLQTAGKQCQFSEGGRCWGIPVGRSTWRTSTSAGLAGACYFSPNIFFWAIFWVPKCLGKFDMLFQQLVWHIFAEMFGTSNSVGSKGCAFPCRFRTLIVNPSPRVGVDWCMSNRSYAQSCKDLECTHSTLKNIFYTQWFFRIMPYVRQIRTLPTHSWTAVVTRRHSRSIRHNHKHLGGNFGHLGIDKWSPAGIWMSVMNRDLKFHGPHPSVQAGLQIQGRHAMGGQSYTSTCARYGGESLVESR